MVITVWKSEFEQAGDPEFQVSVGRGDQQEILGAYRSHQAAWDRAVREADRRGLTWRQLSRLIVETVVANGLLEAVLDEAAE